MFAYGLHWLLIDWHWLIVVYVGMLLGFNYFAAEWCSDDDDWD